MFPFTLLILHLFVVRQLLEVTVVLLFLIFYYMLRYLLPFAYNIVLGSIYMSFLFGLATSRSHCCFVIFNFLLHVALFTTIRLQHCLWLYLHVIYLWFDNF